MKLERGHTWTNLAKKHVIPAEAGIHALCHSHRHRTYFAKETLANEIRAGTHLDELGQAKLGKGKCEGMSPCRCPRQL